MDPLASKLKNSPVAVRVVPFVIFLILTACQGQFGEASRYWFYLAKTFAGVWMIWSIRPLIPEMRWAVSWEAVVIGVAVFVMWVGLNDYYPSVDQLIQKYFCPLLESVGIKSWLPKASANQLPWNPHQQFGAGSALAWLFIAGRLLGSTFVVPPLEEVFFRSFLYRYIIKVEFLSVPLGKFHWTAFLATSAIFVSNTMNGWRASCAVSPIKASSAGKNASATPSPRTPSPISCWASGSSGRARGVSGDYCAFPGAHFCDSISSWRPA